MNISRINGTNFGNIKLADSLKKCVVAGRPDKLKEGAEYINKVQELQKILKTDIDCECVLYPSAHFEPSESNTTGFYWTHGGYDIPCDTYYHPPKMTLSLNLYYKDIDSKIPSIRDKFLSSYKVEISEDEYHNAQDAAKTSCRSFSIDNLPETLFKNRFPDILDKLLDCVKNNDIKSIEEKMYKGNLYKRQARIEIEKWDKLRREKAQQKIQRDDQEREKQDAFFKDFLQS